MAISTDSKRKRSGRASAKKTAAPKAKKKPDGIDHYVASFAPEVGHVLTRIRATIQRAMPAASETISYRMPAFVLNGRVVIYFAAFKQHIGIYPPVRGDARLRADLAPYLGEKGNLRFPLDRPIPYALIARVARQKAKALEP